MNKENLHIFFRIDENGEEFFYPIHFTSACTVEGHVALNPGTLRVENIEGRIVWQE